MRQSFGILSPYLFTVVGAITLRIRLKSGDLVVVKPAGFPQQPADHRAFAIIHATAGDKAQQILSAQPRKESLDGRFRILSPC